MIMEYMNVPTALFSSPEFIGAEPIQRATWIALLAWCCTQENGGIIEGCRSWGMRRWMQTCGVMDKEVMNGGELYHFDGDNLVVFGYPGGVQELLERKRVIARENGKLGGRPKKTHVETDMETEEKPTLVSELTDVGFSSVSMSVPTLVLGLPPSFPFSRAITRLRSSSFCTPPG